MVRFRGGGRVFLAFWAFCKKVGRDGDGAAKKDMSALTLADAQAQELAAANAEEGATELVRRLKKELVGDVQIRLDEAKAARKAARAKVVAARPQVARVPASKAATAQAARAPGTCGGGSGGGSIGEVGGSGATCGGGSSGGGASKDVLPCKIGVTKVT